MTTDQVYQCVLIKTYLQIYDNLCRMKKSLPTQSLDVEWVAFVGLENIQTARSKTNTMITITEIAANNL